VENDVFDLFAALEANDEQLDYPLLYASAREGWAVADLDNERVGECTTEYAFVHDL
jgi:GTP-binding protein